MKLEDAVFNWLQISVVSEKRPSDHSAKKTSEFFSDILREDHQIADFRYERDMLAYSVFFTKDGDEYKLSFDANSVDKLIADIEKELKYN